ncbi:BZ3500_MvSof-1268-A1-R1_Chr6-3g08670 [Microbotryum saponariae]|uniref:BZ3500_MvSof-1268-A1-R1_Chr6-3g08670 protein n=1 Tax=Microbotryum saponariae TaxID=289078 RepID=A0A2X0LJL8_9BASI|nr:BZ3500_MvSof-1268-A1-R1_Chr6-3g08670 [Microbotryum saponariae]SDA07271.1 BZ3501_MvSof-1269-A2-R1_Chr6-2g08373 [Microbotryum saponariae]
MTVKHGHDCLGGALEVVPDALLSRETNLSSALASLVGKIDGKSLPQSPFAALAIIDGATAFARQRHAATHRAQHNEPKRGRLFLHSIIRLLEEVVAATARRIQVVVVFDHPILRPKLKRNTVLDRQDRQQPQQPSEKSTPVTHPVPFITNDTLAACVHGQSSKEWEVAFCHGDEPTQVATFVRWSEQGLLVVAAHEADPLVSASTKFGQICDVALEPHRVVLVSADSDFFMLLGADQARYRAVLSGKDQNISLVDLAVLDAHPAVWNSRQRFVASLILGCDYFRGIKRIGPGGWDGAAWALIRNVDSEPEPTEKRIKEVKSLCAEIDPIQDLLHHYKDETFAKATAADPSEVPNTAYPPIQRNPPLIQLPGISSVRPLPPFPPLSSIQDLNLRRHLAKARRLQAEQPARMASTRKLAVQGTVKAPDYHLVEPEFRDSQKATTAAEVRALFSKQSDSGGGGGDGGSGKTPGGTIYRMSTVTGTLEQMVREPTMPGELKQGSLRVRRAMARTTVQEVGASAPSATRDRRSSEHDECLDVECHLASVSDSGSRDDGIVPMQIDG